jgi:hypothetical protein
MNSNLVKIFAFFIGLFITLIIISFTRINEPFSNISSSLLTPLSTKIKDGITKFIDNIDDDDDDKNDSKLPYKGYKFMCINTYDNINKINANDGKWYEIDNKDKDIYNYNNYFSFSKIINLETNKLNSKKGVKGANISGNELLGPSCFNFANNSETYELTEFTMFITMKYISCLNNNNILFEMTGNTTTINNLIPEYKTSIIHINLIKNENNNYKIRLLIGDDVYEKDETNNIDKDIIENSNYFIIGLYYTKEKIGLIFNDKLYEYINKNSFKITLGSTPIIINKNKSLNMHLYNFIYYKSLFNFDNYDYLIRYNNYYISGLYSKECTIPKTNEIKIDTTIKELDKIEKIELPKFTYSILHKDKNKDDDDDKDDDNKFKSKLKKIFKKDEEDEEEEKDEEDNDNKFKSKLKKIFKKDEEDKEDDEEEKKNLNSKLRDYIDKDNNKTSDDDEEKPNIFKRIFGF